jgi:hypothetical protein
MMLLLRNSYTEIHGGYTEIHGEIREIIFVCLMDISFIVVLR